MLVAHKVVLSNSKTDVYKEQTEKRRQYDSTYVGVYRQYAAAFIVNLGALSAGTYLSWSSSAHSKIQVNDTEWSWVCSLLNLGAFFGSIPTGLISQYFGRKKTLLYIVLPMVISWILTASSPNIYGLYVGRFVGGISLGALSVAISPYVADISVSSLRDRMSNVYHIMFNVGVLFGYIVGAFDVNSTLLCTICSIPPLIYFISFIFLPESPVYLMSQGKISEAMASLRFFRGDDEYYIEEEIATIKEYIKNTFTMKAKFSDLVTNEATFKALAISFCLMIFQQLSGIYPIVFNTKKIFQTYNTNQPTVAAVILGLFFVTFTFVSTMLLRSYSRRLLLMISFGLISVSTASLGIFFHISVPEIPNGSLFPPFILCLYVSSYSLGVGPIPWLMLRTIFPSNIRRRATAITVGFHWFLAFAIIKLYQNTVHNIGLGWVLILYSLTSFIGIIFVYFFVPETNGKSLAEVQSQLNGSQSDRVQVVDVNRVIEIDNISEIIVINTNEKNVDDM